MANEQTQAAAVLLRPGRPEDAAACGTICYHGFKTIAEKHGFPPDFPSVEAAQGLMVDLLSRRRVHAVVAEVDGRVVGSNFLWGPAPIAGVGPITVDPDRQNAAAGRALMEAVLEHARREGFAGVRLVQAAYHNRSLSLYTKLGFEVREPLSLMQGAALTVTLPGRSVRPATGPDGEACDRLHQAIHGFARSAELGEAIAQGSARVVERDGRISGYTTGIGFFGHAVALNNDDLKALVAASPAFGGPGFLLPSRNAELFRWCLAAGLRVVQPMTLMSRGLYNEPSGPFLPSILY
jgi:GNAT superfamily N-acetyltransferase